MSGHRLSRTGVSAYRCASLNKEFANWRAIVHGVERGNLVDTHRGHLKNPRDFVHDTDRGESVLALAEVQDWHDSSLLVLRRVALEEFSDDGLILWREFEGNIGVVIGGVAVLWLNRLADSHHRERAEAEAEAGKGGEGRNQEGSG